MPVGKRPAQAPVMSGASEATSRDRNSIRRRRSRTGRMVMAAGERFLRKRRFYAETAQVLAERIGCGHSSWSSRLVRGQGPGVWRHTSKCASDSLRDAPVAAAQSRRNVHASDLTTRGQTRPWLACSVLPKACSKPPPPEGRRCVRARRGVLRGPISWLRGR